MSNLVFINKRIHFLSIFLILKGRADKIPEQGVRTHGAGFKFRMKLATQKPWMIFQFRNFDQLTIWGCAADNQPLFFKPAKIFIVKFITMAMPFRNLIGPVCTVSKGALLEYTRIRPQSNGSAFIGVNVSFLDRSGFFIIPLKHQIDDRVGC